VSLQLSQVLVYGVVSAAAPDEAVDVFIRLEDAERFVNDVRDDDPELAELLSVEQSNSQSHSAPSLARSELSP
jgi:hypothetical protein